MMDRRYFSQRARVSAHRDCQTVATARQVQGTPHPGHYRPVGVVLVAGPRTNRRSGCEDIRGRRHDVIDDVEHQPNANRHERP